jgi:DNA polymerase I-like protein with 3'-5' exonuclease and polymerase domains
LNLKSDTNGQDPLGHEVELISLAFPGNAVYIACCPEPGKSTATHILSELARLIEDRRIKKVLYDAKPLLAFLRTAVNRKLYACNIFDLMLASKICWSGYYYLTPSGSPKNPWKKNMPDHSLASLAERHLGIILDGEGSAGEESALLLPLHDILAELLAKNGLQRVADLEFQAISSIVEMEISGIHLDCSQAKGIVEQEENEICNLVWTMQDEARKKGFVTVEHDGKRLNYYLNPDRQGDVQAYLKRRGFGVTSTRAEVLRGLAAGQKIGDKIRIHRRDQ